MQERRKDDGFLGPLEIHLSTYDFQLIRNIAEVLEPIRTVTRALPSLPSWLSDVFLLMPPALATPY